MCIHVPPNLFQETRMPNFEETSDLAKQVRKMSIRNAINLLADVCKSGKKWSVVSPDLKVSQEKIQPFPDQKENLDEIPLFQERLNLFLRHLEVRAHHAPF